jgi:multidrug resistance efflux pump
VQRVPVKIVLDPGQTLAGTLRPGMSVEASIDTTPGTGAARTDVCAASPAPSLAMAPAPQFR